MLTVGVWSRRVLESEIARPLFLIVAVFVLWDVTIRIFRIPPYLIPAPWDVAKMLVHRRARRRGFGAALVTAAEDAARAAGRTVLVLDTVTGGDAERLYPRIGWQRVGDVPHYALMPDSRPCATTFFYKAL